jgi:hypothetical protein
MYKYNFLAIGSGIKLILRILPQGFERIQCWYYGQEVFMNYSVEIGSDGMMNIPSFIKIGSGIPNLLDGDTHKDARARRHTHRAR